MKFCNMERSAFEFFQEPTSAKNNIRKYERNLNLKCKTCEVNHANYV